MDFIPHATLGDPQFSRLTIKCEGPTGCLRVKVSYGYRSVRLIRPFRGGTSSRVEVCLLISFSLSVMVSRLWSRHA
jgi:hypothetical protein